MLEKPTTRLPSGLCFTFLNTLGEIDIIRDVDAMIQTIGSSSLTDVNDATTYTATEVRAASKVVLNWHSKVESIITGIDKLLTLSFFHCYNMPSVFVLQITEVSESQLDDDVSDSVSESESEDSRHGVPEGVLGLQLIDKLSRASMADLLLMDAMLQRAVDS
jgi:hypothetical protein